MELTPRVLTTVEFAEKRRGYDPAEVRAFLGEVARAMEGLQQRVRDAEARAVEARREAAPPTAAAPSGGAAGSGASGGAAGSAPSGGAAGSGASAGEAPTATAEDLAEQARRTLVLAQRTADAAVAEAREEAARLRSDAAADAEQQRGQAEADARGATERAQAFAQRALSDAQVRAGQLLADADAQARAESEELRAALRAEIAGLTSARDRLHGDAERLEAFLSAQRERVRTCIDALQHVLDHPEAMSANEVPGLSPLTLPAPTPGRASEVPPVPPPTEALEPPLPLGTGAEGEAEPTAEPEAGGGDEAGVPSLAEPSPGPGGAPRLDPDATQALPAVAATEPGASDAAVAARATAPNDAPPGPARTEAPPHPPGAPPAPAGPAPAAPTPAPVASPPAPVVAPGATDDTPPGGIAEPEIAPTLEAPAPGPRAQGSDPLLSEPEPFDDEQLVRSFLDPHREHGQSRRRRRRQ